MIGIDVIGADAKAPTAKTADKAHEVVSKTSEWLKEHVVYAAAGVGAIVGVLLMAYTGKHAGGRWTGKGMLPSLGVLPDRFRHVSAITKNAVGAVVLGGAAAGAGYALKKHENW